MQYYKYCASGNDFVVFFDRKNLELFKQNDLAKRLCDRYEGLGADGLIIIKEHEKYDFCWDFYNCDGSSANMCGNGARAAAHFAHHILKKPFKLSFLTKAGLIKARVDEDIVSIELKEPRYLEKGLFLDQVFYKTKLKEDFEFVLIDSGVPHLLAFCEDLALFDELFFKLIRKKYDANINIACIKDKLLYVRTFERGVEGETLACGTGMIACFYHAFKKGLLGKSSIVIPKSKERLELSCEGESIFFKAKLKLVFKASLF